jgi:two-component system phosphate regulon sensor histidine kinase PhoR
MDGEAENAEMQREFYNTINQEAGRLTTLIQNLLNVSKIEMGNLTLSKDIVRTDVLVDDCLATIEASAQGKHVAVEKHLPDTPPSFLADKELLKTAIINILGNALKYTPENGKIAFSMNEHGGSVIFDIADTGCGIAQEDLPRVFERFYRSSRPEVTSQKGSGLGLAIAYEIAHLHGGDIDVTSKLGEGSRFTLRIPKEDYAIGGS